MDFPVERVLYDRPDQFNYRVYQNTRYGLPPLAELPQRAPAATPLRAGYFQAQPGGTY